MSIVVTAATGQLGRLVVASVLDRGVDPAQIVATGRSTDRLTELAQQGVRVAELDYSKPADGVINAGDTVLLISGSEVGQRIEQHRNVIELAQKAGAARIVYTSVLRADRTTLAIAPEHVATEDILKASGVPYTILRNGWYTENYAPTFAQAAAGGVVVTSAGDGRISAASRQDFAEAAAAVLTGQGHDGAIYELGGDAAFTMPGWPTPSPPFSAARSSCTTSAASSTGPRCWAPASTNPPPGSSSCWTATPPTENSSPTPQTSPA